MYFTFSSVREEMKEKKKQEGRRHMKKVGLVAAATVGGGVLLGKRFCPILWNNNLSGLGFGERQSLMISLAVPMTWQQNVTCISLTF